MSNLVAAAGVAVVALAAKKLLGRGRGRGSSEDGRTGKRLDDFGALVETFDLEPAPCPSVPQAPLLLTGTTFVVKDNINVKGSPTQYGCPAWSSAKAKANAKCVDLLLKAGAKGVGKTWLDELAFGVEGENPHHRSKGPRNPVNGSLMAGGSSCGSAAAVAGGLCDLALGSDTCGSIRVPAACCGCYGMKTTHGAIPTEGMLALGRSFDTVGWFARDAALLRQAGHALLEGGKGPSAPLAPSKFLIAQDLIYQCEPRQYSQILADVAQASASKLLGSVNVAQVKVENFLTKQVPELKDFKATKETPSVMAAMAAGRRKLLFEIAEEFQSFYAKADKKKMGKVVRRRLDLAMAFRTKAEASGAGVSRESQAVETLGDTLNEALSKEKVLIIPTLSRLPMKKGSTREEWDDWREDNFKVLVLASAAGLPQLAMPLGTLDTPEGKTVPVSLSLVGARGSDKLLLDTAHAMAEVCKEAFHQAVKKVGDKGQGGHVDQDKLMAAGLKDQGNQAFREGRFYDAVQAYSQGIQLDDSLAILYSNRAMALLKLGNFVDAESDCTTCLSLDPSNVKALLRRGTARAYLAQFHAALEDFEQVLVLEPNNVAAAQELERMREAFSTPHDKNK